MPNIKPEDLKKLKIVFIEGGNACNGGLGDPRTHIPKTSVTNALVMQGINDGTTIVIIPSLDQNCTVIDYAKLLSEVASSITGGSANYNDMNSDRQKIIDAAVNRQTRDWKEFLKGQPNWFGGKTNEEILSMILALKGESGRIVTSLIGIDERNLNNMGKDNICVLRDETIYNAYKIFPSPKEIREESECKKLLKEVSEDQNYKALRKFASPAVKDFVIGALLSAENPIKLNEFLKQRSQFGGKTFGQLIGQEHEAAKEKKQHDVPATKRQKQAQPPTTEEILDQTPIYFDPSTSRANARILRCNYGFIIYPSLQDLSTKLEIQRELYRLYENVNNQGNFVNYSSLKAPHKDIAKGALQYTRNNPMTWEIYLRRPSGVGKTNGQLIDEYLEEKK